MNIRIEFSCAAIALLLSGSASAATTWVLGPSPSGVTVTGIANTGIGTPADSQKIEVQPMSSNMIWYSGLGWGINNLDGCVSCVSGDSGDLANTPPEHAIDNNQRYEMALLSFASKVKLTDLQIKWGGDDTDMSVLAYTSNTPFDLNTKLVGRTYSDLTTNGWQAIGNYANASTSSALAINPTGVSSSYWLIGAYNPVAIPGSGFTEGNDYIKLFSVTGSVANTPQSVSEPASVGLVAAALLALAGVRRRESRT